MLRFSLIIVGLGGFVAPDNTQSLPYLSLSHSLTHTHTHTHTHTTRWDSYGPVVGPSQRPPPDNTQHSQETDIHVPAGFEPAISASERPALDTAAIGIPIICN